MVVWVPVVDLSRNQGAVNMLKMRAKGVQGLILRVSHGQTIDDRFATYYSDAINAGFGPEDIAVYTFLNPKRGTPPECARATLDAIRAVFNTTRVGLMRDIENYKDQSPNAGLAPVYGANYAAWIREFDASTKLQAPDSIPFGYTNRSYWNGPVGNGEVWVGDDQLAASYEWIVARYPLYSKAQYELRGYPPEPDLWGEYAFKIAADGPIPPKGGTWSGWQFSAGFNKQGPVYGCSSTDLDLNIIHPAAWRRWTGKDADTSPVPLPGDDDMAITLFELTDDPAVFLAYTSPQGAAIECRWSGPGDAAGNNAVLTYHRNAGALVQRFTKSILKNISLNGPMPPGFTAADFANTVEASAGVDQVARDSAANANAAVARVGQDLGDVKTDLFKAGGG